MLQKRKLMKNRMLWAAGSVMDVWPHHAYEAHMPQHSTRHRLGEYWGNVGRYLDVAIERYDSQEPDKNGN